MSKFPIDAPKRNVVKAIEIWVFIWFARGSISLWNEKIQTAHLVDDGFFRQKNSIILIYQDQRGSLFFLAVDQGLGDYLTVPLNYHIIRKGGP